MEIIRIDETTSEKVIPLIVDFRVTLQSYKGIQAEPNLEWAREEILEFLDRRYPVFAAEEGGE